ncbi:cysteine protease StiP family protein [Methylicorpusculum oleiharenae]|uniref:cysteine protease StiP domain-containing protein n=1 Tax=Methylicorpusculum oleiharenae TaxID=1338687 RepID=UPI00135881DD|nr:cysteine protease StiP domain-containing protein [Methylicorpusculum oleiharenae]MCD2452870.1 cysteine protease StiP family protein [Methylicorpusculum oleiharenae]
MKCDYFSGSYRAGDVRFLLKPIQVDNTPVSIKETLIQSGQKHYSEMLTHEKLPTEEYLSLYKQALTDNQALMARHVIALAGKILATRPHSITLVSLARAGTPVGVLLKRVFEQQTGVDVEHYSISIIRDIGIDTNALLHILEQHDPESLVFVDGWTGKGVIAKQLEVSLAEFAEHHRIKIRPELYVLADLCGSAYISASWEDYLIPSSILNSTVSGLVSRSVIDKNQLSENDFHGCFYYKDYQDADLSSKFVDSIMIKVKDIMASEPLFIEHSESDEALHKQKLRQTSNYYLAWIRECYNIVNPNLIKPGIGESTRVLLRREADILLIRERSDDAVRHLIYLAEHKKLEIHYYPNLPYRATALIKEH